MSRKLPEMVVEDDQLLIGWNPVAESEAVMFIVDGVADRAQFAEALRRMAKWIDAADPAYVAPSDQLATMLADAPDAHLEAAYEELTDIGGEL